MWIEPWSREDRVNSRKDFFYLRCVLGAATIPAFLYVAGLALLGRPMGGIDLTTKVFLGLVGAQRDG
jgi:hypothetical protein